jgi:hypothetical protein
MDKEALQARIDFRLNLVKWIQQEGIINVTRYFLDSILMTSDILIKNNEDNDALELAKLKDAEVGILEICIDLAQFEDVPLEFQNDYKNREN